ncbi:hypothetical protein [Ralstonia wenshanensis]|uniref:hypothetical protein n=1 Tax=Ralstonia wenshanensis TaxID=2842456 RepID=UPI002AADADCC|nr:hypothetical protein [Ralstonia wenshanensis]MDY7507716.1 hypothetical protein [Ralstonia wenshanensis]
MLLTTKGRVTEVKRMTILAATVLPLLVLNACAPVTKSLYSEISQKEYKDYTENVSQILVASNGSKVVVLGSEYHYIIDTPPGLVAVLDSPLHPKVRAQMDQFKVTPTADMTGSFTLVLPGNAGSEDQQRAQSLGFSKGADGHMTQTFLLSGKRYSAKGFTLPSALAKKFNQTYSVQIREELPTGGKAALVLLTPLAIAADGVLSLLAVPLVPLGLAGLATVSAMN